MASLLKQYRRRAKELRNGPYVIETIDHRHFRVVNVRSEQQPVVVLNRVMLTEIGKWLQNERDRTLSDSSART